MLAAIEEISAGVAPVRPGLCALRVPSRFYGGESEAAAVVAEHLVGAGVWDFRMGIADEISPRSMRHVAPQLRTAGSSTAGWSRSSSSACCSCFGRNAEWSRCYDGSIAVADFVIGLLVTAPLLCWKEPYFIDEKADGRIRLIVSRWSSLPHGSAGVVHRRWRRSNRSCSAHGKRRSGGRRACRPRPGSAPRSDRGGDEGGWTGSESGRTRAGSPPPIWSIGSIGSFRETLPGAGADRTAVPESVEALADHGEGRGGARRTERSNEASSGCRACWSEEVLAPSLQGGRSPRQRQLLTPWGSAVPDVLNTLPWPGSIPPPAPTRVFAEPVPASATADGQTVRITERGLVSGEPGRLRTRIGAEPLVIEAWAGPWPIDELWWDPTAARQVARFQLVAVDGSAWLMVVEHDQWWVEARYE